MTPLAAVVAAAIGLVVGSFLNVVIDRVPHHRSVAGPPTCPACGNARASALVPVVPFLRGARCGSCGASYPVEELVVELTTAALFAVIVVRFGAGWSALVFTVLCAGLVPLAVIDFRHHLLPRRIIYPVFAADAVIIVLAAIASGHWGDLGTAAIGGAAWFGVFFVLHAIRPNALGFGDVRLVALLGTCLGWLGVSIVLVGFFASSIVASIAGVGLIVARRANAKTLLPYGVFLALGTLFAVLFGAPIVHHLQGSQ